MPKRFPPEFKRDVVTVARRGDLTVNEVAAEFDIAPESMRRCMRRPTSNLSEPADRLDFYEAAEGLHKLAAHRGPDTLVDIYRRASAIEPLALRDALRPDQASVRRRGRDQPERGRQPPRLSPPTDSTG